MVWKKFLLVVMGVFSFGLSGCFGGGTDTAASEVTVPNGEVFEVDEFSIQHPRDWVTVGRKDFPSNVPKETKLVFQRNVKGEFIANVNISVVTVAEGTGSSDYVKKILQEQRNGLVDFNEISSEDIQLAVGDGLEDTVFIVFEGKVDSKSTDRRYMQTALVKGRDAYVVTGAMKKAETEDVAAVIEAMLKSFKLK